MLQCMIYAQVHAMLRCTIWREDFRSAVPAMTGAKPLAGSGFIID